MHLFAHKTKCLNFSLAWGAFIVSLSTSLFEKKNYDVKLNIEGNSQAQAGTCWEQLYPTCNLVGTLQENDSHPSYSDLVSTYCPGQS